MTWPVAGSAGVAGTCRSKLCSAPQHRAAASSGPIDISPRISTRATVLAGRCTSVLRGRCFDQVHDTRKQRRARLATAAVDVDDAGATQLVVENRIDALER